MISTPEPLVRVRDLRRSFGSVQAVDGVSFDLPPGQVIGFIGANGAGKTTTMRLVATLDVADEGTITIGGHDVIEKPGAVRPLLGWMPDYTGTYDLTTVLDYLDFFARAQKLRGPARTKRLREVLEFTDLASLVDRPMRGLSKGQAQRLALARTLLHDPALLILDEPAAGLDPKARVEFRNLVRMLRDQGKALLISSHILSELAEMCDSLLFIDAGRIVHHGTADDLLRHGANAGTVCVRVTIAGDPLAAQDERSGVAACAGWLAVHPGWKLVAMLPDGARAEFHSTEPAALAAELRRMIMDGLAIAEFQVEERRLEDVFIDMLKKVADGNSALATVVSATTTTATPPPPIPPPMPPS